MNKEIQEYNGLQNGENKTLCELLANAIEDDLIEATSKVWHGAPVWFINDNPVVGYDVLNDCVRLLFWSGQSFDETALQAKGKFKAAEIRYMQLGQVDMTDLRRWLKKSRDIQWDYKNIVKNRGTLDRLK